MTTLLERIRNAVGGFTPTFSDAQVAALITAYQRGDLEVHVEHVRTADHLRHYGLIKTVLTDHGYVRVLTDDGRDLVWSWFNPTEAAQ